MNNQFTVTPEQALELKKAGVKQLSQYVFEKNGHEYIIRHRNKATDSKHNLAAFHVGELGAIIPWSFQLPYAGCKDENSETGMPSVWYDFSRNFEPYPTEAQARAALLLDILAWTPFFLDHINQNIEQLFNNQ
jgi:hypothetical protein